MIKLNETYYDINLIDIIQELKEQLATNNVFLFGKIKELPEDLMISCPFHKDGQEKKPSCGIRKEDGWVHCFTCGESCSLEQMISRCFGVDDFGQFGLTWLKNNFLGDILQKRHIYIDFDRKPVKTNSHNRQGHNFADNHISPKELEKYRYYHPYMYKRQMTDEVIEIFDIGYDKETNCITFPVRDKNGNCLFIARRSVKAKYFNYPISAEKPLYGIYELYQLKEFPREVYVCESMIDAITLWVHKKYAVALNGLGTKNQIEELNNLPCRKFILATDNDVAGQRARQKLRDEIHNQLVTEIMLPKGRKDVNECTFGELENLLEIF